MHTNSGAGKNKVTNEDVVRNMKQESLHFTNNIVKQKLAYAGQVPLVQMLCCCWAGSLKERKQQQGLEGYDMEWWAVAIDRENKYKTLAATEDKEALRLDRKHTNLLQRRKNWRVYT